MSWSTLPTELQLAVLEHLAQLEFQTRIKHKPNTPYSIGTSLSRYATVSEQWRGFFEPRIMDTLHVTRNDMEMFAHVFRIERRRKYLRQIALVIRLPDDCPPFRMREEWEESAIIDVLLQADLIDVVNRFGLPPGSREVKNNVALLETVYDLFVQLSIWNMEHVRNGGIGLELLADSRNSWQVIAPQLTAFQHAIDFDGNIIGTAKQQWLIEFALDNFNMYLGFDVEGYQGPALELPMVDVVTSLSIMRRSRRRFDSVVVSELMARLPALKQLVWEMEPMQPQSREELLQFQLSEAVMSWPRHVDSIQIVLLQHHIEYPRLNPDTKLIRPLPLMLADQTQFLRHLYINFPIDAFYFFRRLVKRIFPTLQTLTIWSTRRIVERAPSMSHYLLRLVIRTLLRMPNMQFLTVYNMESSEAGLFNYDTSGNRSGRGSFYQVCSSWAWEMSEEMDASLSASMLQKATRGVSVKAEELSTKEVTSLISTVLKTSEAMGRVN
ncbi:hypothetical protein HG530_001145 [Fusarium avenaceum]|nr:hypothetical protein HG530_001145 [Fusarium avenaceum]